MEENPMEKTQNLQSKLLPLSWSKILQLDQYL